MLKEVGKHWKGGMTKLRNENFFPPQKRQKNVCKVKDLLFQVVKYPLKIYH